MKIAFASGKGGTGKTTVSANLARTLSGKFSVQYIDCDVEEPNGHLFLKPQIKHSVYVKVAVPKIDDGKCTNCAECASFCAYNAIASLPGATLVFPELCHGCGGCRMVCPEGAITEVERKIGVIERGDSAGIDFIYGRLDVGEAMSAPVIRALGRYIDEKSLVLIDSPPGANCSTLSSLNLADKIVLTAEPTPFGLNDLKLIVEMVRAIGKPFGVIINRVGIGDDSLEKWLESEKINVFGRIPDDIRIARLYSKGILAVDEMPRIKEIFEGISLNLLSGGV